MVGRDLENLNAFRFTNPLLCATQTAACPPPPSPFLVGDTVYRDFDGDGEQGPDEPGIPGVRVTLLGENGEVIAQSLTDGAGRYSFEVEAGTYVLRVGIENFDFGAPLAGMTTTSPVVVMTTAGDEILDSVVDTNVLTYDFPYRLGPCGCDGKVTELRLRYTGSVVDAAVVVAQRKGPVVVFDGIVQPGGEFSVFGVDKKGTLGPEILIWVDGTLNASIHTSCSQPIGPGLAWGDFLVVSGNSRNAGDLCPFGLDDDFDHEDDGDE